MAMEKQAPQDRSLSTIMSRAQGGTSFPGRPVNAQDGATMAGGGPRASKGQGHGGQGHDPNAGYDQGTRTQDGGQKDQDGGQYDQGKTGKGSKKDKNTVMAFRGPFAAVSTPQFPRIFRFCNAFRDLLIQYLTPFHFFHDFRSSVPSIADGRGSSTDFGFFPFFGRSPPTSVTSLEGYGSRVFSFILRHPSHSLEIS